jgi:DMSO/TMAO reductase YedYZ molybdopterin-dependent catalytic subunit
MKIQTRLFTLGGLLLALALVFAACGGTTPQADTATEQPAAIVEAPAATEPGPAEDENAIIFEIASLAETKTLSMADFMALPVTEGYGGIKSSTGKITPPMKFKGVALKDIAIMAGMDETNGLNVVAEDGYSITFSYEQVMNGAFIAYDPATGDELKNPVELTAIVAYEVDGQPLDTKRDGILRMIIVSDKLNQVTDGHWAVKWVEKVEIKPLVMEWHLKAFGGIEDAYDRGTMESCSAPQCHGAGWVDDKGQEWVGTPLYILVGGVDDENKHEGPDAYNKDLVRIGYTVDVVAEDGYTVTFDALRLLGNKGIIVAHKVDDNPLEDKYFPMRLVGDDLQKNEMVGAIREFKINFPAEASSDVSDAAANVPAEQATFTLTGLVEQELSLDEAALRKMEVLNINAEHPKKGPADYEGISLNALLDLAGVQDGATTLVVTSADGYVTEISLDEIQACVDCLLGFTDTPDAFSLVMPGMPGNFWAKDVVNIEVK